MTTRQTRVERTKREIVRVFNRAARKGGVQTALDAVAAWHLRHGGRAPGETPRVVRVNCDTCFERECTASSACPTCWRRYDLDDNWRPRRGGAR